MQKDRNLTKTVNIRSEVNFLTLPYFTLDKKPMNGRTIEFRGVRRVEDETYEIVWMVHPHPDFGLPRDFERRFHRAVEYILSTLPRPVKNPISLGSFRGVTRIMGVPYNGNFVERLKNGILKMVMTGITSRKAYYNKQKKRWIEKAFHLYEKAVFVGETLDDGTIADNNYLYLCEEYLANINSGYLKTIDYTFLISLRPISGRLYEILGVKFYGHPSYVQYRYSTICMLLPAKRWKQLSKAKNQLNPAHNELVKKGILGSYEWLPIPGIRDDWYIRYVPALMYRRFLELPKSGSSDVISESSSNHTRPNTNKQQQDHSTDDIKNLLESVPEEHRPKETIRRAIASAYENHSFDYVSRNIRYANKNYRRNYRAFLVTALKKDWGLELQEDEEAKKEMLRQKAEKARKEQQELERVKRVRSYIQSLSKEDRQKLRVQAISELGDELNGKDDSLSRILIITQMDEIASRLYDAPNSIVVGSS